MGLQNSPVGSQSWLSSLLQWIKSTVSHNDLLDVVGAEYDIDDTANKHISDLIYKRSVDHISDNARHLTDNLDGTTNYIDEVNASGSITVARSGSEVTIGSSAQQYTAGKGITIAPGNIVDVNVVAQGGVDVTLNAAQDVYGIRAHHFSKTVILSATTASAAVSIIHQTQIEAGKKVIILGFFLYVYGSTAWSGGTLDQVRVQDNVDNEIFHVDVAKLTGNAIISPTSLSASEVQTRLVAGTGSDAGYGINFQGKTSGGADADAAAGSDIYLTVYGVVK